MSLSDPREFIIVGAQVLLPEGQLVQTNLAVENGNIVELGGSVSRSKVVLDYTGTMVLPGIVDLHGDGFERQIMPRPSVFFPLELALLETDRQLLANGITTAFHAVTYSWEPGLRGRDFVLNLLRAIKQGKMALGCDTRFHLRFEIFNLAAVEEVLGWLDASQVDLLAFNNHMPSIQRKISSGESLLRFVERTGLSREDFIARATSVLTQADKVDNAVKKLAAMSRRNNIPLASHDDETIEIRRFYHELGCALAEFPLSSEAIGESVLLGDCVILGAPNVVRGGSHLGKMGVAASAEIAKGRGDILCSDYYYPALMEAPFVLAEMGIKDFPGAWNMISSIPASAAKLYDRGEIAVGKRADLVIVNRSAGIKARTVATFVAGRTSYSSA